MAELVIGFPHCDGAQPGVLIVGGNELEVSLNIGANSECARHTRGAFEHNIQPQGNHTQIR